MAIRTFRCNLKAANFPLLTSYFGRSVAVRAPDDSDYISSDSFTGTAANDEIGIAQVIYCHNIMPNSHGVQSVGYSVELDNSLSNLSNFDQALILRSKSEQTHILSPASGVNYINSGGSVWSAQASQDAIKLGGPVTKAYVAQRCFICYKNNGVLEYDSLNKVLNPVTITGVSDNEFDGICYSNNFLIAYTTDTVYWSSVLDPLDFTPSLSTGASSAKQMFARGAIVSVLPIHNGFVIYTTANAISAFWTGDLANPWIFREIPGSAGINNPEHVSYDSNYGTHFAWTSSGLMQITKEGGLLAFPQVTDFLTCGSLEDYVGFQDSCVVNVDNQLQFAELKSDLARSCYINPLKIKISFIGSRFLAISYGTNNQLTHILVYDLSLKRWGKLRVSHVDVFQYQLPTAELPNGVKETFGILQANGTILTVDFSNNASCPDSVILFGRVKHSRANYTSLYSTTIDGILTASTKIEWIPSPDGASLLPAYTPMVIHHNKNTLKVSGRKTSNSFVVKILGTFNLSSLEFNCESAAGGR